MTGYDGWWQVPDHLLSATALGELDYPRRPTGDPAGWVKAQDWAGRTADVALYDARSCPPTAASAAQLAAARRGQDPNARVCADCGAHCQRPLPGRRCPACQHIARLRAAQAKAAADRAAQTATAAELLGDPATAVVHAELVVPPPTARGHRRRPVAATVDAIGVDGGRLCKVTVRLVGPRAHHIPAGAVSPEHAAPALAKLQDRRLLVWASDEAAALRRVAPARRRLSEPRRITEVCWLATCWRGQLDPRTYSLVPCLAPGTADRLLHLLGRIAGGGRAG